MLELKILIDDIDYNSVTELLVPLLAEKLEKDGKGGILGNVLAGNTNMAVSMARTLLNTMSQEKKDELVVQLVTKNRDKLLQKARESHVPLSQQEVRTILTEMAEQGLARVSRGRGGSQLTPKGRELWEIGQRSKAITIYTNFTNKNRSRAALFSEAAAVSGRDLGDLPKSLPDISYAFPVSNGFPCIAMTPQRFGTVLA